MGFYGTADQGQAYLFPERAGGRPFWRSGSVGEYEENLLEVARATKDAEEVAHIREAARRAL